MDRRSFPSSPLLRRVDRIVADLNVLLVVIAIGLATLDMTLFLTQRVVANLPPITRLAQDAPDTDAR